MEGVISVRFPDYRAEGGSIRAHGWKMMGRVRAGTENASNAHALFADNVKGGQIYIVGI
jgi:hypothetical protein